jgi:HPt (histidine-containing phosphotransfer) domain-containing protein
MNMASKKSDEDYIFLIESEEMLIEASRAILEVEHSGIDLEAMNKVFRAVHSIKGGAQMIEFFPLAEIAHHLEDLLVPYRQSDQKVSDEIVGLILNAVDLMQDLIAGYKAGSIIDEFKVRQEELLKKIGKLKTGKSVMLLDKVKDDINNTNNRTINNDQYKNLVYINLSFKINTDMLNVKQVLIEKRLSDLGTIIYFKITGNLDEIVITTNETYSAIADNLKIQDVEQIHMLFLNENRNKRAVPKSILDFLVRNFEELAHEIWNGEVDENNQSIELLEKMLMNNLQYIQPDLYDRLFILVKTLKIWLDLQYIELALIIEKQIISIWEELFPMNCTQEMFRLIKLTDKHIDRNILLAYVKQDDIKYYFIDLSEVEVLELEEYEHLRTFKEALTAEGKVVHLTTRNRRHLFLPRTITGLALYSSPSQAFFDLKGGDELQKQMNVLVVNEELSDIGLSSNKYSIKYVASIPEAEASFKTEKHHIVIIYSYNNEEYLELVRFIKDYDVFTEIIVVKLEPSIDSLVQAFEGGIYDFLVAPVTEIKLIESINGATQKITRLWSQIEKLALNKKATRLEVIDVSR